MIPRPFLLLAALAACDVLDPEPVTCGVWTRPIPTVSDVAGATVALERDLCLTPTQAAQSGWTLVEARP